jgi:hypothetical protein
VPFFFIVVFKDYDFLTGFFADGFTAGAASGAAFLSHSPSLQSAFPLEQSSFFAHESFLAQDSPESLAQFSFFAHDSLSFLQQLMLEQETREKDNNNINTDNNFIITPIYNLFNFNSSS